MRKYAKLPACILSVRDTNSKYLNPINPQKTLSYLPQLSYLSSVKETLPPDIGSVTLFPDFYLTINDGSSRMCRIGSPDKIPTSKRGKLPNVPVNRKEYTGNLCPKSPMITH